MRARPILLVVAAWAASAVLLGLAARAAAGGPKVLVGEPVVVKPPFAALRADLRPFRPLGETLRIGEHEFAVRAARGALTIARAPGLTPAVKVRAASTIKLRLSPAEGRRAVSVHLRPVGGGADGGADGARGGDADGSGNGVRWEYAVVSAARFEIDRREVLLIDANGDGRFRVGEDAVGTPREPMLLPLTEVLVVGRSRFSIESLAEDGSRLTGTLEPLAGERHQIDALVELNQLRARSGLPPVVLDEELSAACSAHVEYLRKNKWSGYSNPHGEVAGRPGYSEAGNRASTASVIVRNSHVAGIQMHFLTYYHRIAFANPRLERVGISVGSQTISVIDAQSAAPDVEADEYGGWDDPILSPPDGAIGVPTRFCSGGEVPEPVSNPASRGYPLMLLFGSRYPVLANVRGDLVELRKGKERTVPTLAPKALDGAPTFGVIPAKPLAGGAVYRVTFTYERDGEAETASATFTTK